MKTNVAQEINLNELYLLIEDTKSDIEYHQNELKKAFKYSKILFIFNTIEIILDNKQRLRGLIRLYNRVAKARFNQLNEWKGE